MDALSCCWAPRSRASEKSEWEEKASDASLYAAGLQKLSKQAYAPDQASSFDSHLQPGLKDSLGEVRRADFTGVAAALVAMKRAQQAEQASAMNPAILTSIPLGLAAALLLPSSWFGQEQSWQGWAPTFCAMAVCMLCLAAVALYGLTSTRGSNATEAPYTKAAAVGLAVRAHEICEATWSTLGLLKSEVSRVQALRQRLSHPVPDFVTVTRFLRARGWDMQAAEQQLRTALEQRAALRAPLRDAQPALDLRGAEALSRYWRGDGLLGLDHDGDPILWERPALLDWQGLSLAGEAAVVALELFRMEALMAQLERLTVEQRRPVHRFTVVVDLEGLSMSFARPDNLKVFRRLVDLDSTLYPETIKCVLLVRAEPKFYAAWKILGGYFEEGTRSKIRLVPAEELQRTLLQHVPPAQIPRFLGGPARLPAFNGERISRRLLRQLAEADSLLTATGTETLDLTFGAGEATEPKSGDWLRGKPSIGGLSELSQRLRSRADFAAKEAALPRSAWNRGAGTAPPPNTWGVLPDASDFPPPRRSLGSSWQAGQRPMLELLDVDIFRVNEEKPLFHTYEHASLASTQLRALGDDRFLLLVNWIVGPYQMVVVSAFPHSEQADPGDSRLFRQWLALPPAQRWRRLRIVAAHFDGPYIVQEIVKLTRPSHLGKFHPIHSESRNHLEVSVHLTSSDMRRVRVVFQHSYHLIVNGLAYFLCADGPGEGSDRLLFAHYCSRIDVERLRELHTS